MDQNEAQGAANAQGDQPNNQTMESLLETESLSVELPQTGEIRKGMIASIGQSQILVSIGAKSEGVINARTGRLSGQSAFFTEGPRRRHRCSQSWSIP